MAQTIMDLVVYEETKVVGGIYMWELEGYRVVAANMLISHCSGVTVFYHEADYFSIKALCLNRSNAISF